MRQRVRICGLWERDGRHGAFMSGTVHQSRTKLNVGDLEGMRLVVYPNDRRVNNRQPEWYLVAVKDGE